MEALIRTLESADWVYQEDLSMLQNNIYDVGRRVAVYWKRDQKYHHGRIIALRQKADQMAIRYTVLTITVVNEITFYRILTDLLKGFVCSESTKSVARGQRREPLR